MLIRHAVRMVLWHSGRSGGHPCRDARSINRRISRRRGATAAVLPRLDGGLHRRRERPLIARRLRSSGFR